MKTTFLILFLGANMLSAQHMEGGYLKLCDNLKSSEAKIACTDSTLLEDVKNGWTKIKNEIESGKYMVTYSIYSKGDKESNQIILVPQRVVLNSKSELLLELVDKSVKKYEWVLPKWVNDDTSENEITNMHYAISRYLKINTTVL